MTAKRHRVVHPAPAAVTPVEIVRPAVNWLFVLLAAVSLVLLIKALFFYRFILIDDAFISFRYARHLAAGAGPTYNIGRPPIEGYTSFLWVVVMALPHLLGIDVLLFARIVGALCTLGTLLLLPLFTARFTTFLPAAKLGVPAALAGLLLVVSPFTAIHANSGMETALYVLLVIAFLYTLTLAVQLPAPARFLGVGLLALLVALTRPEGNLLVIVGLLTATALLPRGQRMPLLARVALLYLLPIVLYHCWRLGYYGQLFPLPFYVKVAHSKPLAGWHDMWLFAIFLGLQCALLLLCACLRQWRHLLLVLLPVMSLLRFLPLPSICSTTGSAIAIPPSPPPVSSWESGWPRWKIGAANCCRACNPQRGKSLSAPSRSGWRCSPFSG